MKMERPKLLEDVFSSYIDEGGFDLRMSNWLRGIKWKFFKSRNDIYPTIGDILNLSEEEMISIRSFGKKSLIGIKLILAAGGIPLERDIFENRGKYFNESAYGMRIHPEHVLIGEVDYKKFSEYGPFNRAITFYWDLKLRDIAFMKCLKYFERQQRS